MRYYTGVGSRQTPPDILEFMTQEAELLRSLGFRLRSGHAPGADQAFERGAGPDADIFLPWMSFEKQMPIRGTAYYSPSAEAHSIAALHYPVPWTNVKQSVQKLMARNVHQVLGYQLNEPSDFLMCWTPGGKGEGGTGQAIRVAKAYGIRVYDLGHPGTLKMIKECKV